MKSRKTFAPSPVTQILISDKEEIMGRTNLFDRRLWLLGKSRQDIVGSDDDV